MTKVYFGIFIYEDLVSIYRYLVFFNTRVSNLGIHVVIHECNYHVLLIYTIHIVLKSWICFGSAICLHISPVVGGVAVETQHNSTCRTHHACLPSFLRTEALAPSHLPQTIAVKTHGHGQMVLPQRSASRARGSRSRSGRGFSFNIGLEVKALVWKRRWRGRRAT